MNSSGRRRSIRSIVALIAALTIAFGSVGSTIAVGLSFGSLPVGFSQNLFGVSLSSLGGIAFAPNGDTWVNECSFAGGPLHRFSAATTTQHNGSSLHTESAALSNAGCGMVNHPDSTLYSNASFGVTNLDANTAAVLRTLGVPGNALGIAVDPQSGHLVYVAADCRFTATCTLIDLDPTNGSTRTFARLNGTDAQFVDGITFDPGGNFLFLANRAPLFRLSILNRLGVVVRHVALASEPDGIAVHAGPPTFVVTNNTDGTLTRLDFPDTDFASPPGVSIFASSGFRGDLASVGQDGCLYVTQGATRFDDGTTSGQSSLVRICGPSDFSRAPGVFTPTPTPTSTPTVTQTVTQTVTPTPNVTASVTPSVTPTPTVTASVTPSVTPTPSGLHSLALDGVTGYAESPATATLNLTGDWTVELWLRDEDPNGFLHDYRYLLDKGDGVFGESPFYVLLGSGNLLAGLRSGGVNHPLTYDLQRAGYAAKIWQHVAATFQASSTTLTLYLDGRWAAQESLGVVSSGNSLPLEIGRQGPITAKYWLGKIDDVRIWNIARTEADINATYRTELTTVPNGLVANWKFDEGCGSKGVDAAGQDTTTLQPGTGWSIDVPSAPAPGTPVVPAGNSC